MSDLAELEARILALEECLNAVDFQLAEIERQGQKIDRGLRILLRAIERSEQLETPPVKVVVKH